MGEKRTRVQFYLFESTLRWITLPDGRMKEIGADIPKGAEPHPLPTLASRFAELEATLANERGEGEGPSPGWEWFDAECELWVWRKPGRKEEAVIDVYRAFGEIGWHWGCYEPDGSLSASGETRTARDAMKAADAWLASS